MLIYACRRAKLKRLTTDDQERMTISRALPVDFDFSQTLYPTSRKLRPLSESALIDPLMLGDSESQRPSLRLGMGHLNTAFNSKSSSFTQHFPSPVSAISSIDASPVSSVNRPSQISSPFFSSMQSPLATSTRSTNPLGRSHSLSSVSNQNSTIGLGCQQDPTTSSPISSLAKNIYGYGDLPRLQLSTTPLKTVENQSSDKSKTTEGPTQASGLDSSQYLRSSVNSPNAFTYDQSRMLSPSGSAFQTSSYCQSQPSSFRQESQIRTQEYQYGQQLQPH